jgi:hypothetical protein
MATLKKLFDALLIDVELCSAQEIMQHCKMIIDVQGMSGMERVCLCAAYLDGPLFDGDVPSKEGRNSLIEKGYMTKVVVKGEDGFNACTHKGAWAYRLIQAGA